MCSFICWQLLKHHQRPPCPVFHLHCLSSEAENRSLIEKRSPPPQRSALWQRYDLVSFCSAWLNVKPQALVVSDHWHMWYNVPFKTVNHRTVCQDRADYWSFVSEPNFILQKLVVRFRYQQPLVQVCTSVSDIFSASPCRSYMKKSAIISWSFHHSENPQNEVGLAPEPLVYNLLMAV